MRIPITKTILLFSIFCYVFYAEAQKVKEFSIVSFGAKTDSTFLNTIPIQAALDAAAATGGIVVVPVGTFYTGTLIFRTGTTLKLEKGAVLKGSPHIKDYHKQTHNIDAYSHKYFDKSLIYAENVKNIRIFGEGTIDGNGKSPAFVEKKDSTNRPTVLRIISCQNVVIDGITLVNSPNWMQHYLDCNNLIIKNITVVNHARKNNDGLDIDGCKNVQVYDCKIDADDDALCFKGSALTDCENITVTNCELKSNCNALKFGTESLGGIKNALITNCILSGCDVESDVWKRAKAITGIALEIVDGGRMENIKISGMKISNTYAPFFIRLGNRGRKLENSQKPGVGSIKNIEISDVTSENVRIETSTISGIPGFWIEEVVFKNIKMICNGGVMEKDFMDWQVPENEDSYPEVNMFGKQIPASVFYIRHVKNIKFENFTVQILKDDLRPLITTEDTHHFELSGFVVNHAIPSKTGFYFRNSTDIVLKNISLQNTIPTLLTAEGESSGSITVDSNSRKQGSQILELRKNAPKEILKEE